MFIVKPSTVEAVLPEIAQGGYDVIGTTMLLTAVIQCREQLEQQYNTQMYAMLVGELLDVLSGQAREVSCLVGFVQSETKARCAQ